QRGACESGLWWSWPRRLGRKTVEFRAKSIRACLGRQLGLANGALLAHFGAASRLAWLFVVFAFTKLLGKAAALNQLLEPAQRSTEGFTLMPAHSQGHAISLDNRSKAGAVASSPAEAACAARPPLSLFGTRPSGPSRGRILGQAVHTRTENTSSSARLMSAK